MSLRPDNMRISPRPQSGFSMIEVLVSLIILMVGLLGLAGLMAQSQRAQMDSYQRVQALIIAKDMVARINANRAVAANLTTCYGFSNAAAGTPYVGDGGALPAACAATASVTAAQAAQANKDIQEWHALLQGATETVTIGGVTSNAGGMVGARGCVSYNATSPQDQGGPLIDINGLQIPGTGVYTVEVTWQGDSNTFVPPNLNCATGTYGASDARRRDLSLTFRVGSVNNTLTPHPYP